MTRYTRDPVLNRTVLASTISALMAGGAAHAQQPAAAAAGANVEEITVTGSRILRRDLNAPTPIMTVDAARLENSSTLSIESVLNQMPQFVPEGTQFDQGIQAGPTASLGIGSVNLRGIGANRSLVLIDGRRAQPANAALLVDTNSIPAAAIERVETITGGASAVYGADAMAGVVNFILKKDFEGVDMDFHYTTTEQGDGAETRFTTLLGVNSDNHKGNVMLGIEWYDRSPVLLKDRDFYRNGWFDKGSDAGGFIQMPGYSPASAVLGVGNVNSGGLPTQAAVDQIFLANPTQYAGYFPCNGWAVDNGGGPNGALDGKVDFTDCTRGAAAAGANRWTVSNGSEIYFNPDGTPFVLAGAHGYNGPIDTASQQNGKIGTGYAGVRLQPNGNLGQVAYVGQAQSSQERHSLFGRATHELNDHLTAFAQANYASYQVNTTGGYPPAITVWSAPVPVDGRPIPAALQTLLASRTNPTNPWTLYRVIDFLGDAVTTKSQNDVFQIMAGVDGTFSKRDWTWEAYVSSGETNTTNFYENMPSLQRYQNLINAIPVSGGTVNPTTPPTGPGAPNSTWGRGTFTSGRNYAQTCTTGLPIFTNSSNAGAGEVSADCVESIVAKTRSLTKVKQNIAEFNLQGKITDMRAGELRFAAGMSTRKNEFSYDPGETNDRESVAENPMSIFASNNTAGQTKVNELYGELLVPVAKRLELEFGARLSDYVDSDIGTTNTWKSLFTWHTTDKFTVRGGLQHAERAPNTAELFQGVSLLVVPFAPSDPCSFTTTATWGNQPSNPNRVAVQNLCRQIINNSDLDPSNDNKSVFDTGAAGPNGFARPGNPFFPLEIELRKGSTTVPGNSLQPESGDTATLGVVMQINNNLSASLDYYNVDITDAIAPLNSLFAYQQCFNANGSSNPTLTYAGSKYCALILRNVQSGERSSVDAPFINTGSLKTDGIDVAVNWRHDLGKGQFYINSLMTFLGKYDIQDAPGTPVVHEKDTLQTQDGGQYKYKVTNQFGYNFGGGKAGVALQWRYLPAIRDESLARTPTSNVFGVGSYQSFNLSASYTLNEKINLRMGIDNLTDEQPPVVGARPGDNIAEVTRADYYDILGRRAFVGVTARF